MTAARAEPWAAGVCTGTRLRAAGTPRASSAEEIAEFAASVLADASAYELEDKSFGEELMEMATTPLLIVINCSNY